MSSQRKRFLLAIFVFLLGITGYHQVSAQTVSPDPTTVPTATGGAVVPTLYCLGSCPTPTSVATPTPLPTAAVLEPEESPTDIPELTPIQPSPTPAVLEPDQPEDKGGLHRRNGQKGLVPRLLDIIDKLINKVPDANNGATPTPSVPVTVEPTASGELTPVPTGALTTTPEVSPTPGTLCADDVKTCPDGSAVGREGPTCSFPACPKTPRSCVKVATFGRHDRTNKCQQFKNSCLPRFWKKVLNCSKPKPPVKPSISVAPTEIEPTEGPIVDATPTLAPDDEGNNHEHGLLKAIINMLKKIFELIRQFFGVEVPPVDVTPTPAITEAPTAAVEPTTAPTEPPAATEAPTQAPTTAVEPTVAPTTATDVTPAPTSVDGTPVPTTTPPANDPISQLLQILIQFLNQLIAALKGFFGQA